MEHPEDIQAAQDRLTGHRRENYHQTFGEVESGTDTWTCSMSYVASSEMFSWLEIVPCFGIDAFPLSLVRYGFMDCMNIFLWLESWDSAAQSW